MKAARLLIAFLLMLGLTSCQKEQQADQASNTGATSAVDFKVDNSIKLDGEPVTVAGVTFAPPSTWKYLGASGMRQAVYAYGPTAGESDSATMVVFYFGATGGGGVEANIQRWMGQMSTAEGGDVSSSARQQKFTADDMQGHWVEVSGTYNPSMGGGGMPGGPSEPKENYHMAAAVLEGPQGNLFFKLTGPQKTATEMVNAFKTFLLGVKKSA